MIGCGGIARWHMTNLAKIPEAEIVALAEPSEAQIDQCRRQFRCQQVRWRGDDLADDRG